MPGMRPRFITNESKVRRKMCQADILRNRSQKTSPGTSEEFLGTLGMCVTIRAAREADLQRAEELTIRTNQLNTTGRTYSYEELRTLLDSRNHLLLVVNLEDRYGSSGTVGLALIRTAFGHLEGEAAYHVMSRYDARTWQYSDELHPSVCCPQQSKTVRGVRSNRAESYDACDLQAEWLS